MDIDKINNAVEQMVKQGKDGIESIFVYDKNDGLVITGHNIDYEKSAVYHDMCINFKNSTKNFNFSNGIKSYYILLKNKKVVYSGILSDEFLFTVILDTNKIQLGYFKGYLLKKFFMNLEIKN